MRIGVIDMGKVFDGLDNGLREFIAAQPLFFVATAPLSADHAVPAAEGGGGAGHLVDAAGRGDDAGATERFQAKQGRWRAAGQALRRLPWTQSLQLQDPDAETLVHPLQPGDDVLGEAGGQLLEQGLDEMPDGVVEPLLVRLA